jgi:hypothetical protein
VAAMTVRDKNAITDQERTNRFPPIIEVYLRALGVVMMVIGLRQWAIILGVISVHGMTFETMPTPWQLATIHLAVVDLVASVGLWMRAEWGSVIWIYAALSEIALHTVFAGTFRNNVLAVGFHLITISGFIVLHFLARRGEAK